MEVDPELACGFVAEMGQLWPEDKFVDLEVCVGECVFKCHRFILNVCSKIFKVYFESEIESEAGSHASKLFVDGISPEIFHLVLKAVYKGENVLIEENMIAVWHAAYHLQIPFLFSKCEKFVNSLLREENFVKIYKTAIHVKSEYMLKAAHQFVAHNFDSLKDLDILLQQPASSIEDIIGSNSLIGQVQNHVVEFILKWVNFKLPKRETENMCPDSTTGDLTLANYAESTAGEITLTNKVSINDTDSCQVIIQNSPEAFNESEIKNLSDQPMDRTQSLGELLKLVRFAEVSKENLQLLADNDLVKGCEVIQDIIAQPLDLCNYVPMSAPTSAPTAATVIDTEDAVVFVSKVNRNTIYAYSLDRGKFFTFLRSFYIANIQTYNHILLSMELSNANTDPYILKVIQFPFSQEMQEIARVRHEAVIAGDFIYTLNKGRLFRKNINDGDWNELVTLGEHIFRPSITVFKDSVLYYNTKLDHTGRQHMYCFNTVTRKEWPLLTCDNEDCDFVTLTLDGRLYIIYSNGMFVDLSDFVNYPYLTVNMNKYSEIPKHQLLWDFQLKIYGAVAHRDCLVVFCDLNSVSVPEEHSCRIPGLRAVKFVYLHDPLTKCHPLVLPRTLLT